MTQLEKTIIQLYREGYATIDIANAVGEDRSYVGYILDCYFGWARPEQVDLDLAATIRQQR